MEKANNRKSKHMGIEERIEIQAGLDKGLQISEIAKHIRKDPTTVSKEIKKHLIIDESKTTRTIGSEKPCPKLESSPYVCNACKKRHTYCPYPKHIYLAKSAHSEYRKLLSEARSGISLSKEEFFTADRILLAGIRKGQHIYHITKTYNLGMSSATVYRHIKAGHFSVKPIDLPRAVKFKPRKSNKHEEYVPKALKKGRTYTDFREYMETNSDSVNAHVELDTVIGRIGGKAIMTLHFTLCNFMIGILLEQKNAAQVSSKLTELKRRYYENTGIPFSKTIPVILTDNGSEFSNISAIETDPCTGERSKLFFCDPYHSSQKPQIEKNHTMLRDIIPSGSSFDELTQQDVNLVFSHINSVKRVSLNGKTPYEFFRFTYGDSAPEAFGISKIPPEKVCQSPLLLPPEIRKSFSK